MAFNDPLSIDIGAGATALARIESSTAKSPSVYMSADGTIKVSAQSTYARRTRQVLRLDTNKVTPDPFIPSNSVKVAQSIYIVFDRPAVGYDNVQELAVFNGFRNMMGIAGDSLIKKLLAGES
jgi:hypothetical protein